MPAFVLKIYAVKGQAIGIDELEKEVSGVVGLGEVEGFTVQGKREDAYLLNTTRRTGSWPQQQYYQTAMY